LIVTGCIGRASKASQVDECGAADVVGNALEGELECMAKESGSMSFSGQRGFISDVDLREVTGGLFVSSLLLGKKPCESHNVCVDLFILNWRHFSV
jgi:hypothetical protein